jgi:hypothetical protein
LIKNNTKGIYYYKITRLQHKIADSVKLFYKTEYNLGYFDIGASKRIPYLKFVNKYHENWESTTIVALNMLNGMYYNHKNNNQRHLFLKNAIKLGKEDENQIIIILIRNIQSFY